MGLHDSLSSRQFLLFVDDSPSSVAATLFEDWTMLNLPERLEVASHW